MEEAYVVKIYDYEAGEWIFGPAFTNGRDAEEISGTYETAYVTRLQGEELDAYIRDYAPKMD